MSTCGEDYYIKRLGYINSWGTSGKNRGECKPAGKIACEATLNKYSKRTTTC